MKIVLIVTGASRGFGKAIAKAFCSETTITKLILVARNLDPSSSDISCDHIRFVEADLSDLDHLDESIDTILQHATTTARSSSNNATELLLEPTLEESDHLIFVNNAGSLGPIGPCAHCPSLGEMRRTVDLNVTSALWMSVRITQFATKHRIPKLTIVQISSLVAIQPFPTLGIYSAGKAARDSFHKVLAMEEKHRDQSPDPGRTTASTEDDMKNADAATITQVRVLNYAPGPLETDMTEELRSAESLDPSLKPMYQQNLVAPADSAAVLVHLILGATEFESGSHIDYYDARQWMDKS
jgi:sepiapterin reductase